MSGIFHSSTLYPNAIYRPDVRNWSCVYSIPLKYLHGRMIAAVDTDMPAVPAKYDKSSATTCCNCNPSAPTYHTS